jgi:hypothetical protein
MQADHVKAECLQLAFLKLSATCKLTADSALMIVLSLATSAAYFGCTNRKVRWKFSF